MDSRVELLGQLVWGAMGAKSKVETEAKKVLDSMGEGSSEAACLGSP